MQEKPSYTLRELFDNLPISLRQLGKMARVNEVTVARIRDGEVARRSTLNRLLAAMSRSDVYNRSLSLANVTGVIIQGEMKTEGAKDVDEDTRGLGRLTTLPTKLDGPMQQGNYTLRPSA